jgi:hypothetical protein
MAGFAPAPAGSTSPVVRLGKKLIIPAPLPGQAAVLPPLCVKCGAPADGKTVTKTFYWHSPVIYLTILLGLLIYVIVALVVRKSIKVGVPLCAQHAQRRSIAVTLAWVLPLIGIADAFVLPQFHVDGGVIALITFALILAGLVTWLVVANPIRPAMIDAMRGEFTGACAAFLERIPEAALPGPAVPQSAVPPPPVR